MSVAVGGEMRTRDDRSATEKADGLANQVNGLMARVSELNARLVRGSDPKGTVCGGQFGGPPVPAPMRMLHDSLDEAADAVVRINNALDTLGQRL